MSFGGWVCCSEAVYGQASYVVLAYSAGPIDEAVFWASLIAALPIGFGYLCRYILSGKIVAPADTVLDPGALPQAQNATTESRHGPE